MGQWSLTCQSALVPDGLSRFEGELYFPVLRHVVDSAAEHRVVAGVGRSDLPIVADLACAWDRCATLTERARALGLSSHNARVPDLYEWHAVTAGGDLRLIWRMPHHKAQCAISASVVSLAAWQFQQRVSGSTHGDAARRLANWRSVCDPNAGLWVTPRAYMCVAASPWPGPVTAA